MEEERDAARLERKRRLGGMAMFLLVIAVLSLFMKPGKTMTCSFENDMLTIEAASGYTRAIGWDEILSVEEREALDYGVLLDGIDEDSERSGTWKNDEFGSYSLCVDPRIYHFLVLRTADGVMVVNYGSVNLTKNLASAIRQML